MDNPQRQRQRQRNRRRGGGGGGEGERGGGGGGRGGRRGGQGRRPGNQNHNHNQHNQDQDAHSPRHDEAVSLDTVARDPEVLDDAPPVAPAPTSTDSVPLGSRKFSELADANLIHGTIVSAITQDLGFTYMTPVQAASLDDLLPPARHDCLVQAKTGSGKTIAFLLPALQTMITQKRGPGAGVSLLVISPTRELALQIAKEGSNLLQRMPQYRIRTAIGGTNKDREERQILSGCDILVATPGRLLDHMANEDIIYSFRNLDTLVLDEADRLLDMGFMKALRDIVSRLPDKAETNRQGMLFSATIADHVKQVAGLVCSPNYKFISTIPAGEVNTHQHVPQLLIKVPTFSAVAPAMVSSIREEALKHEAFKAILFAPTAALADFYGHILSNLPGFPPVSVLHSRMSQSKRTKTTNEYHAAKTAILVATDVVARGMDFPGVTTVFQVGVPLDKQSYIHRLGRTARASADGRGIFIVTESEEWFPKWTLKEIPLVPHEADFSSAANVHAVAVKMDDDEKAKVYQAWLGYYNNHLRSLRWDKVELVAQANMYARDGLASPEIPTIARTIAGKMGLRGVKGLVIVPDPPRDRQNRGNGGGGRGRNKPRA